MTPKLKRLKGGGKKCDSCLHYYSFYITYLAVVNQLYLALNKAKAFCSSLSMPASLSEFAPQSCKHDSVHNFSLMTNCADVHCKPCQRNLGAAQRDRLHTVTSHYVAVLPHDLHVRGGGGGGGGGGQLVMQLACYNAGKKILTSAL